MPQRYIYMPVSIPPPEEDYAADRISIKEFPARLRATRESGQKRQPHVSGCWRM